MQCNSEKWKLYDWSGRAVPGILRDMRQRVAWMFGMAYASISNRIVFILDIRASRHPPSAVFASAWAAAGALFSTARSEHAHLYGITLLAPGGRRGCTSGCWYPDGTLPVDL